MANEPKRPSNLPAEAFWYNGKSRWEMGEKINNKPVGKWLIWRKDGTLWMEMTYNDNGEFDGPFKRYHTDATLSQEGSYRDGKQDGWCKFYRHKSGSSSEPFPNDVYNYQIVRVETYFNLGKKLANRYFLANSDEVDNYARARPKNITEGAWWNNSNYEWEIGEFNADGKPIGRWVWWRYGGIKVCEAGYDDNGALHGYLQRFHDNGSVSREGMYEHGNAIGDHHFYRSDDYTQESFLNNMSPLIYKHSVAYEDNKVKENRYYDKKGIQCSSKGFEIIDAQVEDLFEGNAERFLQDKLETYFARLYKDKFKASDLQSKNKRSELFRKFWGMELPDDLALAYDLFERADAPRLFRDVDGALPKFQKLEDWEQAGQNVVEAAIVDAQAWYPYDFVMDWFTGTLSIDSLRQSAIKNQYYHYSYHYGLYGDGPSRSTVGLVYVHEHNSYSSWGTNFRNASSNNLSTFLYGCCLFSSYDEFDLIKESKMTNLYNQLKPKLFLPYYFLNNMRIGNRYLSDSDFSLSINNKPAATSFDKSRWILELLRGEASIWEVKNNFYRYHAYKPVAEEHAALLNRLGSSVPEAFYHLWAAFLIDGFEAQLLDYIRVCKGSNSIIIQHLANLVESLYKGRNDLGILRNLRQLKQELNG